jgi:hypothetical protein
VHACKCKYIHSNTLEIFRVSKVYHLLSLWTVLALITRHICDFSSPAVIQTASHDNALERGEGGRRAKREREREGGRGGRDGRREEGGREGGREREREEKREREREGEPACVRERE